MGPSDILEHSGEGFFETDFSNYDFTNHTFEDCTFENCDLKNVVFARCRLIDCSFRSCDLSNVALANAIFRGISFENCKLLGIQWVQLATLVNLSFKESNLNYCGFGGLKLKKTPLYKCSLREADFSQADLSECDVRESDLRNARFNNTILLKADFRGASNYLIDPITNKVRGARFSLPEAQGLLVGLGIILE